jgi:transposase
MDAAVFVGIDVAKAHLDLAVHETDQLWQVANDPAGIDTLVARLQALAPTGIVCEASGGYERELVAACVAAGLPLAVVNPRQVRAFATALGRSPTPPLSSWPPC